MGNGGGCIKDMRVKEVGTGVEWEERRRKSTQLSVKGGGGWKVEAGSNLVIFYFAVNSGLMANVKKAFTGEV